MTPDKLHPPEGTETISWEFEGVGLRVQDRMDFTGEAEPPLIGLKRRFTFGAFVTSLKNREAVGHHFPTCTCTCPLALILLWVKHVSCLRPTPPFMRGPHHLRSFGSPSF